MHYQTLNIAPRNSHIMSDSSRTLRTLILERIQHLKPTANISEYEQYSDRDLLDDFEEALADFIEGEQGLNSDI